MRRPPVAVWLLALAGAGWGGCWRSSPPALAPFELVSVAPDVGAAAAPLLLNDSVTLHFSAAVRPITVTPDTVAVYDAEQHLVPGRLDVGSNWVSFTPEPPRAADLTDGSFRPGETYKVVVAGYPRHDTVRAVDGRRLAGQRTFLLRMAEAGPVEREGVLLPAPLRPPSPGLPLLLCAGEVARQLPADAPVMRLQFTAPVLPVSARPEAFEVLLLRDLRRLLPRSVRIVPSLAGQPGSTLELDLGPEPRILEGGSAGPLQVGDRLSVSLVEGAHALRDFAGNGALPSGSQWWEVCEGAARPLLTWPVEDGGAVGDDPLAPGFESVLGIARPRIRIEAGDGRLGVFRPRRDTILRPGEPFDRGDGVLVRSRGDRFGFLAVDIPSDVRVRVEGHGVCLQSCGGLRVAGELELAGPSVAIPSVPHGAPVRELLDQSATALVAAGDIVITGRVVTADALPPDRTALTVASAGRILLGGELPYNTMLAVENVAGRSRPAKQIVGARGETSMLSVTFDYGLAEGAALACRAVTSWRPMPPDRDGGVVRLDGVDAAIAVTWQTVAADPIDPARPDPRGERWSRPRPARSGEWIPVEPGSYVRFLLHTELEAASPVPQLLGIRLTDR